MSQPWSVEDRDLDGEGEEKGEGAEPEGGRVWRDQVLGSESGEDGELEGAGFDVEPEDADEEQGRGNEVIDEVLEGGGAAVLGADRRWR